MSSRIKRRVTLEKSSDNSSAPRKPSVFERLGPGANSLNSREQRSHVEGQEICRQWHRHGSCSYGSSCRFYHSPLPNTLPSHTESSRAKQAKVDKKYETFEKPKSKSKPKKEEVSSKEQHKSAGSNPKSSSKRKGIEEGKIKSTVVITHNPQDPSERKGKSWGDDDSEDADFKEEQMLERKRQQLKRELQLEEEKEQFNKHQAPKVQHSPSSSSSSESSSSDSSESSSDSSSSSSSSSSPRRSRKKRKKSSKEPGEIRDTKRMKPKESAARMPRDLKSSSKDRLRHKTTAVEETRKKHISKKPTAAAYLRSKKSKERLDRSGGSAAFNDKPDRAKRIKNKKKNFKGSKGGHHHQSKKLVITGSNTIPLAKNRIKAQTPPVGVEKKFQRAPSPRFHQEKRKELERSAEQAAGKRIRLHSPPPIVMPRFLSPNRRVEEVTRTVRRRSKTPPSRRMQEASPPLPKRKPSPMGGRDYDDGSRSGYRGRSPPPDMKSSRKGRIHEDSRRYDRDCGRNSPIVLDRMPPRSPDRQHMGEKERPRQMYRSEGKPPNRSLSPRPLSRLRPRRSPPPDLELHDYPLYPSRGYLEDRGGGPFSNYPPPDSLYNTSPPYHQPRYPDFPPSRKESYLELEPRDRGLLESRWPSRHHSRDPEEDWDYHCLPDSSLHMDGGYGGERGRPRRPLPPSRKGSDWPRHDPRDRPFSPGQGPPLNKGPPRSPKQEPGNWERHPGRESRKRVQDDPSRTMVRRDSRRRQSSSGVRKDMRTEEEQRGSKRISSPPLKPKPPSSTESDRSKDRSSSAKSKTSEKHTAEDKVIVPIKAEPDTKKSIKKEVEAGECDDGEHPAEDYSDWTDEDADLDILTKEDEFVEVKEVTNADDVLSEPEHGHDPPTDEKTMMVAPAEGNVIKEEPKSNEDPSDCVDYDPISDEDFEALIEENEEKPGISAEPNKEQLSRIAMALQVDWSSLTGFKSIPDPVTSVRQRLSPRELLLNMGFSQELAGPELTPQVLDWLLAPKSAEEGTSKPILEHPVAAFHELIRANKKYREEMFYKVGSFRRALCSRHDLHIRKLLAKSLDKVDWSAQRELSETK